MQTLRLVNILERGQNNLNLVRLFAALAVLFGHSFALYNPNGYSEPVRRLVRFEYSGSIAVYVFFYISGMLITASFAHSRSAISFVLMRAGRIMPGLIVCLLITTFALGPVVTELSVNDYLRHPGTSNYFFRNALLGETIERLPGVFGTNYFEDAVNGSLWTLAVEVRCYMFVLIAGLIGALSSTRTINFTCLMMVLAYWFFPEKIIYFSGPEMKPAMLPAAFFLFGMFCFANRHRIVIDPRIAIFIAFAWIVMKNLPEGRALLYLLVAYATLVIAAATPLKRFNLKDDCSYGVYIYGFVIQQSIAYCFPGLTAYQSLLVTVPICLALGFVSWRLIEKPSLKLAQSLVGYWEGLTQKGFLAATSRD
jgi:peptidoglycan/LPS O-acetylase OafA/YrhL